MAQTLGRVLSRRSLVHEMTFRTVAAVFCAGLSGALLGGGIFARLTDFVVAPSGDDRNPGTEAQPLATIRRARDAVREFRKGQPDRGALVLIRDGNWHLTVVLPGESPRQFHLKTASSSFRTTTWLGFVSDGTQNAVYYLDNIRLSNTAE